MAGHGRSPQGAPRILVIEDEKTLAELLCAGLTYEGFEVSVATGGEEGLRKALKGDVDLIILDIMLPDIDGFEICRRLRLSGNNVPIIMLTAKRELSDRITGLNLGADDYIVKPFSFEELLARIRAVLRRRGNPFEPTRLQVGDIVLDLEAHEAYRAGKRLDLTPKEFALLELFMRHPRRVFQRDTLLNRIWGLDYEGDRGVVDVHISNLRRKLGDRARRLIRTIYGLGYSFDPSALE